jgi:hypothetical protein
MLLSRIMLASPIRDGSRRRTIWMGELLEDMHPRRRPAPLKEAEHEFGSLEEAQEWLGNAEIRDVGEKG